MENRKKLLFAAAWYKKGGSTLSLIEQIIQLEESFLGYTQQSDGWTMSGQWYADNIAHQQSFARDDWCAMFQTYCMYHTGISGTVWPYISPQGSAVNYMSAWFDAQGIPQINKQLQLARRGDIVFYTWASDPNPDLDHIGLITNVSGLLPATATLTVIEGNKGGAVGYRTISQTDVEVGKIYRIPYTR